MHVISRKKLLDADDRHGGLAEPLDSWYRVAKFAQWRNLQDIRNTYPGADGIPIGSKVLTVFNICGNRYRLVTEIYFDDQVVPVRHVLTHAEYTKGDWKR